METPMTDGPTPDLERESLVVTERINDTTRRQARGLTLSRYGGEELAFLPSDPALVRALAAARRIVEAAARDPLQAGRYTFVATCGDGVAALANRNQYELHCETPHTHLPGVSRHTGRSRACG
jgi:GGDEF domain-containing protein